MAIVVSDKWHGYAAALHGFRVVSGGYETWCLQTVSMHQFLVVVNHFFVVFALIKLSADDESVPRLSGDLNCSRSRPVRRCTTSFSACEHHEHAFGGRKSSRQQQCDLRTCDTREAEVQDRIPGDRTFRDTSVSPYIT